MEIMGLTKEDVDERVKQGKANINSSITTKSIGKIIFTNVFTLFNILNFVFAFLIILMKEYKQVTFLLLILINITIGLVQEIRAKKTIDKLSLISQPKVHVIRDGNDTEILINEIVLDDIMLLESGMQVCSDCEILEGICEVNESMLTGESDAIIKKEGDTLLSGSFIVSGKVTVIVTKVSKDNYATKISNEAKKIKSTRAQIPRTLQAIIRFMSFIVIPLGLGIFIKSYFLQKLEMSDSILKMTASTISMIPQGLVALSSMVFGASVLRLGSNKTLCQDLYCVETLARVDTLCLDKTGTITEGVMQLDDIIYIEKDCDILDICASLMSALPDNNPTANAIGEFVKDNDTKWQTTSIAPFSSKRKWSGATFEDKGSFIIGASEFVLAKEQLAPYLDTLDEKLKQGERVLCVAHSMQAISDNYDKPDDLKLLGFLLISDKIRKETAMTMNYFYEQGVDIRIISGDNPITVSAIARKAGIIGFDNYVDASTLLTDEDIENASRSYKVFGRVTPEQKLSLIKALKKDQHTVAMTGDGVNDVLALKEADCSIAMAEGSDAARTVSHLVLLNNNFNSLPKIVKEGRRTINNLQRTASLYLVKTIYSALLALFFLFVGEYPFEPMHMTLVGSVTIGIPSVLLSFMPNSELVKGRFITNILKDSFPSAIAIVLSIILLNILKNFIPMENSDQLANVSVALISIVGFGVLLRVCLPLKKPFHSFVFFSMILCLILGWGVFYKFLNLIPFYQFTLNMLLLILPIGFVGITTMFILQKALSKKRNDFLFINKLLRLDNR
jgi:cation-transporting ATPase E